MYAIKVEISDPKANYFEFAHQKTMYGGKRIATGNTLYLFASENEGGIGLVGKGVVVSTTASPRRTDVARQTPRITVSVRRTALAKQRLGRNELKPFTAWNDGRPQTELNFKFYRQATNKIAGVSAEAVTFLESHF